MKMNLVYSLSAAAAGTALMAAVCAPAQAVSLNSSNFGSNGILFDTDTEVRFTFWEAHGKWKSTFGVYEIGTKQLTALFSEKNGYNNGQIAGDPMGTEQNDWLSSRSNLTGSYTASFTFKANTQYALAYWGKNHTQYVGQVKDSADQHFVDSMAAVFEYDGSHTFEGTGPNWKGPKESKTVSVPGSVIIGMEDGWEKRNNRGLGDFNDFVVSAEVPEPMTMGGVALVGGAMAIARRRRDRKAG